MRSHYVSALDGYRPLQERRLQSDAHIDALRTSLTSAFKTYGSEESRRLCIFAAGSLGRGEAGERSDLDPFIVYNNESLLSCGPGRPLALLEEYEAFAALITANRNAKFPRFDGEGRYLKIQQLSALKNSAGSPRDDTENTFTARMLLILESQPIFNLTLYYAVVESILEHYFRDSTGKRAFRPLFLLNDILRYWRTLCLNYEEFRHQQDRPWLKKNLKLKFARRLTIFSTVLCILAGTGGDRKAFAALSKCRPLNRLALAMDSLDPDGDLLEAFQIALRDYEGFLSAKERLLSDPKVENEPTQFIEPAERFAEFFHRALTLKTVDQGLFRYVVA